MMTLDGPELAEMKDIKGQLWRRAVVVVAKISFGILCVA